MSFGLNDKPKTYTIVRIEHSDGYGMFRPNMGVDENTASYKDLMDAYERCRGRYVVGHSEETYEMLRRHTRRHTPHQDKIKRTDDMFCAFDSLETFNALVTPEEVRFLLTKDFKVLMMEVTRVEKGEHQVCYRKQDVISTKDISSLF